MDHASVHVVALQDRGAVQLSAGEIDVTFVPSLGMLGASLRHGGDEYLSLHGGLDGYASGHTTGLPLLAPWANRLSTFDYRAAGQAVDVTAAPGIRLDPNGLPIHGTMGARPAWEVVRLEAGRATALLRARFPFGDHPDLLASFPFPHDLVVEVRVDARSVSIATSVIPTGRRRVPVSFGWHPYYLIPGTKRRALRLRLPARHHLVLDDRMIPTGESIAEDEEDELLGRRTFDDSYQLGRDRHFALSGGGRQLRLTLDRGYPFAQVYAPAGSDFVAIEPMTAPTDALVSGGTGMVKPGERFTAKFRIELGPS